MAISIPANTTAFVNQVISSLSTGTTLNNVPGGSPAAPINFIRTQDMVNVLRLLQAVLTNAGSPTTATAGSSTSVTTASTYVVNAMVGYKVTFGAATTTTALQGVTATVTSNSATVLTFAAGLPAAPVAGDTFTYRAAFLDNGILDLMGGHSSALGEGPVSGRDYDSMRLAQDCLTRLCFAVGVTSVATIMFATTAVAGTSTTNIVVDTRGTSFRIDEFRGYEVLYNGTARRRILGNTANTLVLDSAVTAPSGGEAVSINSNADDSSVYRCAGVHGGGQPGNNYRLASFIDTARTAIAAWTNPA